MTRKTDGTTYDAAVAARAALLERARRALPQLRTDGMSDRAIMEAMLAQLGDSASFAGRSDDYVRGYFDKRTSGRTDSAPQQPPAAPAQHARTTYQPAWREPLRYSAYRIDGDGPVVVRDEAAGNGGGSYRAPWRSPLRVSSSTTDRVRVRE